MSMIFQSDVDTVTQVAEDFHSSITDAHMDNHEHKSRGPALEPQLEDRVASQSEGSGQEGRH